MSVLCLPFWHVSRIYHFKCISIGLRMRQDVFLMNMDQVMERCPTVMSIHGNLCMYGYSEQEHDDNLLSLK